ncbi:MAG: glutathione S-transferase [Alphaproteobacteria bacterium]|jgi:glutathione S-transferase
MCYATFITIKKKVITLMKLYGMPLSTRVNKVRMFLALTHKKYAFEHVNLFTGDHKSQSFLDMSIMGKIPVLDDGGYILSESNSILRYLAAMQGTGSLYPSELQKRCQVDRWLDYVSMHVDDGINRILFNIFVAPHVGVHPSERSINEGKFAVETALPIIEAQLKKQPFIAGECMTIADISLLSTLDPLELLDMDISAYKTLVKWQEHMKNHDFYRETHHSYADAFKKYMASFA